MKFVGRESELKRLKELTDKRTSSFIVVRGRRRIGKSRLIQEFGKYFKHYFEFTGLAPVRNIQPEDQLEEFSLQLAQQLKIPTAIYRNWSDAFWTLAEKTKKGKILILFDEISWMGSADPTFLSKIKNLWDLHLKKNNNLIFVLCGSASSWIEKNILSSTAFLGRISLVMTIEELSLKECGKLWNKNISDFEKLKILSVTGGVPKYLEEINYTLSAEENIKRICFSKGGFLVEEFERIFSDIFLRNSKLYKKIVSILSSGSKEYSEIQKLISEKIYGRLSEYLSELELAGFIKRDYSWSINTTKISRISSFRLKDNYLRFYLKYIEPNIKNIKSGNYTIGSLINLQNWYSIIGLQFENLVINNGKLIIETLNIKMEDVICANPFIQRKNSKQKGCQIDYMIQTRFNTIYVCEIKFSHRKIGNKVIKEVQEKIKNLKIPKGFSLRPVLIHVNGIENSLPEYFSNVLDMGQLCLR